MAIEPYRIDVPQEALDDLRQRLARTRFPDQVNDDQWSYGTDLTYLKELVEYWRTRFDWRAAERALNELHHFRADVDGLGIHFVHERGKAAAGTGRGTGGASRCSARPGGNQLKSPTSVPSLEASTTSRS